ncbi:UNVERIFIED_CONTAM: hypothetical protein RMT77_013757 [Armadillidium vulgare]
MSSVEEGLYLLDQLTTKDKKLCLETLIKIFRNVVSNPNEVKYRSLKLSNKRFISEVWQHEGAQVIMVASGWVVLENLVHLPEGSDLTESLKLLIDNREVKPEEGEWVAETKIMGENRTALREEELRKKAMEEKAKEMAKLKKDLAERKAIAESIVREHRNDIENRRTDKPSIAAPRGSGKSSKMSDMVKNSGGGG